MSLRPVLEGFLGMCMHASLSDVGGCAGVCNKWQQS